MTWELFLTDEVNDWLDHLAATDRESYELVVAGIEVLAEVGPNLGRPLVDRIKGSRLHNLKELCPGSSGVSELRVLSSRSIRGAAPFCSLRVTRPGTGRPGTARRSHEQRSSTTST